MSFRCIDILVMRLRSKCLINLDNSILLPTVQLSDGKTNTEWLDGLRYKYTHICIYVYSIRLYVCMYEMCPSSRGSNASKLKSANDF